METETIKRAFAREATLFVLLAFVGTVLLPAGIYIVGNLVFGAYEHGGLVSFIGALQREAMAGEPAVLFLLLSPWILWQLVRVTVWGFRRLAPEVARDAPEKL